MERYYLTTAIIYVNALPHVGHALEMIGTDAMARYKRLTGYDVFFLTGTDENSLNAERRARELGIPPQQYVDQMANTIQQVWRKLNISNNAFIRTTDPRHVRTCQDLFRRVRENGDIYKSTYEGWYCVSCEAFRGEDELVDGCCPFHPGKKVEWLHEENYFFRLSKYQEPLLQHIEAHPEFIEPEIRRNEIVNFIKSGLQDFSVSRSSMRWGIPVPGDPTQVLYVWFDALINYVTGVGYDDNAETFARYWPADLHVVGKDITRFHAIYWPAMLLAAGLPLPKRVFGHGFVYQKGERMSKSRGNVVDPGSIADEFGADPLRYYLMREVPFDRDGDFAWPTFVQRYNSDLGNDLGNLLNRTVSMLNRYFGGTVPEPNRGDWQRADSDRELIALAGESVQAMERHFNALDFSDALIAIWDFVKRANKYVEENAPWALQKTDRDRLATVMYNLAEANRLIAHFIYPVMPETAANVAAQLNVPLVTVGNWTQTTTWGGLPAGTQVTGKPAPLFPRITEEGIPG
ncbi:MAG: methionine--tRNA ligase [Chloroflexota bacterium]